jgi:Tfp pilus assembly protein PilW
VTELLVASAVALLVALAIGATWVFGSRSFVAMANYVDLDQRSQTALDKMSREIRQVGRLTAFSSNMLTFQDYDNATLKYIYNPDARTLTRVKGSETNTFLTECDSLQFSIYQRTPKSNEFEPYDTSAATNTKLVQMTWTCSRKILGAKVNTESVQSAKIVIRKK